MGLLLFVLGLYVSTKRGRTQQIGTTPQNPAEPLFKAIRAHGNTAEYAPMLAVLMLYLGTQSPSAWVLWVMIIVTVCRYMIVVGIIMSPTLDKPHPLRFIGALGTYVGGAILSIVAFFSA
jgi:uncharacterized membrane protein YecN with MAPEG domain